jgi:hypothetical protein
MALEKPDARGLVGRWFPAGSPQRLDLVRAAWPLAVGPDLARRTEVLALEGRTLRVRVPDARWRKVLHRMRGEILARMARIAGDAAPDRLGFQEEARAGRRDEAPEPIRPERPPVPPPLPPEVARGAQAIADPELRRAFTEAAARYLARAARPGPPREKSHA